MHALPTITEFALSYHTLDDFFLALQDTGPASDPAVGVPRWPDLHTLTLSDHGLSAGADIRPWHLLSTVEKRIEMGHPLRKLRLSKSIIQQVKNMNTKTHWNDLCERLTVELFSLYPKRAEELIIWHSGLMVCLFALFISGLSTVVLILVIFTGIAMQDGYYAVHARVH